VTGWELEAVVEIGFEIAAIYCEFAIVDFGDFGSLDSAGSFAFIATA